MTNTQSFNKLTPAETERLALLLEELGEAQQAIGKILRHGYEQCSPEANPCMVSNRKDLEKELGDVEFAISLLCDSGDVRGENITLRAKDKSVKVKQYLHHQE